ncbi:MAG TPA: hypothetical protein PK156_40830 [Polyangium sp.]|nr:hypothetical protein [Polyangium sp.]
MKRFAWLLVAVALLGLAAFLMSRGDKPKRARRDGEVDFPRHPKSEEHLRNERRRTLPPARPKDDDPHPQPMVKRDPVMVALPTDKKKSAMVFEIAGLRDSPVGKAWLDCLMKRDGQRGLDKFQEEFGLNPVEDIERVAVSSTQLMIMSVSPDKLDFSRTDFSKRTFGSKGVIYQRPTSNDVVAMWGNSLVLTGPNAKVVEEAIQRLESGDPTPPAIPEWSQYGDVYGSISPEELAQMLPEEQAGLAAKVREAVERVDVHLDASEDVAIVADVEGPGEEDIQDLGKSFGAALSLARMQAQREENDKVAELLDYAAVHPRGNRFALDVALPFDVIKEMGPCRKREVVSGDAGPDDDRE